MTRRQDRTAARGRASRPGPGREALAELILAAAARPGRPEGARLPTERQLAADLGVTRTAVRHVMAMLQADGRVSREVGRGTFLRAPDDAGGLARDDAGGFAPADVMTVRRLLEPQVMPLVVAWATAGDLAEMQRCLEGGDRASSHEEFESWDCELHRCIIAASHSPLLIRLYADVAAARHGRMWGDLKRRRSSPARRLEYQRDHREIVTAVRVRDADRAAAAMGAHLARVSRHLLGGQPGNPQEFTAVRLRCELNPG